MTELVLKLVGPAIPVMVALIQLGREGGWLGSGRLRGKTWTFALIGTIILGGIFNSGMTWQTHRDEVKERQTSEKAALEREQQAQKERREIADVIRKVEIALGREHDPKLSVQEALGRIGKEVHNLMEQASTLESELEGLRKYGDVAKMDAMGLPVKAGKGIEVTTPVSRTLEGAYEAKEVNS